MKKLGKGSCFFVNWILDFLDNAEGGQHVTSIQIRDSYESEKQKHNEFVHVWGNLPPVINNGIKIYIRDGLTGGVMSKKVQGNIKEKNVVKKVGLLLYQSLEARLYLSIKRATGK